MLERMLAHFSIVAEEAPFSVLCAAIENSEDSFLLLFGEGCGKDLSSGDSHLLRSVFFSIYSSFQNLYYRLFISARGIKTRREIHLIAHDFLVYLNSTRK